MLIQKSPAPIIWPAAPRALARSQAHPVVAVDSAQVDVADDINPASASAPAPRLLTAFSRLGKETAMAVANGVGALALFLPGPHTGKKLEANYREGQAAVSSDSALTDKIGHSAFDGLLELMRRSDLPGESAQQRLDFVMWLTDSNRDSQEPS